MCLKDTLLYIRFYIKTFKLRLLKKICGLDFEGRFYDANPMLNGYEGCYSVKRILRKLKISSADSVLDIGCGKGLFLYYARKFKFKKIDGIEYSSKLFDAVLKNLEIMGDSRIHIFNCDARDFENYSDYNMFFMCNPFASEVMEVVVSKIVASYKQNKRKIVVYYQFPFFKDYFLNSGFRLEYCDYLHGIFILEK